MANIHEVKKGLRGGKSYQRTEFLDGGPCTETVSPAGVDEFDHSVSGMNAQGGHGGGATLSIDILPGRFDFDGWEQIGK